MNKTELMKCNELVATLGTEDDFYIVECIYEIGHYELICTMGASSKLEYLANYTFNSYEELKNILEEKGLIKWKPQIGEIYYTIWFDSCKFHVSKELYRKLNLDCEIHSNRLLVKNCFKTREEAQEKLKEILKIFKETT